MEDFNIHELGSTEYAAHVINCRKLSQEHLYMLAVITSAAFKAVSTEEEFNHLMDALEDLDDKKIVTVCSRSNPDNVILN
jgi:hypothetical protein